MFLPLGNLELGVEAETGQRGAEQHSHIVWASISIGGSESHMEDKVMGSQKQEFSWKGFFFTCKENKGTDAQRKAEMRARVDPETDCQRKWLLTIFQFLCGPAPYSYKVLVFRFHVSLWWTLTIFVCSALIHVFPSHGLWWDCPLQHPSGPLVQGGACGPEI